MLIGVSSPKFSLVPIADMFELVAEHKFELFEIIAEGLHYLPSCWHELKTLLDSYDFKVTVHAPLSDINIASINAEIRACALREVRTALLLTYKLELELLTFHPGHLSPLTLLTRSTAVKLNCESIVQIIKWANDLELKLALENLPFKNRTLCTTAGEFQHVLESEPQLRICFDIGHANIAGEIENFIKLKSRFINIHLHDNDGKVDSHWVIGSGNIDFQQILKQVLKGYKGDIVIEANSIEEGSESRDRLIRIIQSCNLDD